MKAPDHTSDKTLCRRGRPHMNHNARPIGIPLDSIKTERALAHRNQVAIACDGEDRP